MGALLKWWKQSLSHRDRQHDDELRPIRSGAPLVHHLSIGALKNKTRITSSSPIYYELLGHHLSARGTVRPYLFLNQQLVVVNKINS